MRVLELFSGTGSVGREAQKRGFLVHSIDIAGDPTERADLLTWDPTTLPFVPDFLWASPPCVSWSRAAQRRHRTWDDLTPRTEVAVVGEKLVLRTLELIRHFLALNPRLRWCIENPRGMLRRFPPMAALPMVEVYYCQYGRPYQKATHIWTNTLDVWTPSGTQCTHGRTPHAANIQNTYRNPCHEIPAPLVSEILDALCAEKQKDSPPKGAGAMPTSTFLLTINSQRTEHEVSPEAFAAVVARIQHPRHIMAFVQYNDATRASREYIDHYEVLGTCTEAGDAQHRVHNHALLQFHHRTNLHLRKKKIAEKVGELLGLGGIHVNVKYVPDTPDDVRKALDYVFKSQRDEKRKKSPVKRRHGPPEQ